MISPFISSFLLNSYLRTVIYTEIPHNLDKNSRYDTDDYDRLR